MAVARKGLNVTVLWVNVKKGSGLLTRQLSNYEESGLRVMQLDITSAFWKFIYTLYPILKRLVIRTVYPDLKNQEYDVIHSNVIHPAAVIGDSLSKKMELPHIISEHFSKVNYLSNHLVFGKTLRRIYNEAHFILPVSDYLGHVIEGVSKNTKIEIVPNIIDRGDDYYFGDIENTTEVSPIRFVAVAHWHKTKRMVKRPDLIIQALGELKQEGKLTDFSIEFIGGGNQVNSLQKLTSQFGLSVHFSGNQNSNYIGKTLRNSTFFLHASTVETFSVVTAEALACGLPVIASKVGAIPELINKENGVLVDNTIESWKKGILHAVNTNYDKRKISENTDNRFDYTIVGDQLLNIYNRALP